MSSPTKLPPVSGYCRPGQFAADARAHATTAQRRTAEATAIALDTLMQRLLGLLLLVLLGWCLSCKTVQTEARTTRAEHAAPANLKAWHAADSIAD